MVSLGPPASTPYDFLFDIDEHGLMSGSGSALLDDYVRLYAAHGVCFWKIKDPPQQRAILAADAGTRGDIYARLCAFLTTTIQIRRHEENKKNAISYGIYRGLKNLHETMNSAEDMVLPGVIASAFLVRDARIARRGFIEQNYWSMDIECYAPRLLQMVANARKSIIEPTLRLILETTLAKIQQRFDDQDDILDEMSFVLPALACLGRTPSTFKPAWVCITARKAVKLLLDSWQNSLHPLLWELIDIHANNYTSRSDERKKNVLAALPSLSPGERGIIFDQLWLVSEQAAEHPVEAGPNYARLLFNQRGYRVGIFTSISSGVYRELWEALAELPSSLSPDFAQHSVESLGERWPISLNFAKSVAAVLTPSQETRDAVEKLISIPRSLTARGRRVAARQAEILRAAVLTPIANRPSLEQIHAKALGAFATAYEDAWKDTVREMELSCGVQVDDDLNMFVVRALRWGASDYWFNRTNGRQILLGKIGAIAKTGPVPHDVWRKLGKIERSIEIHLQVKSTVLPRGSRLFAADFADLDKTSASFAWDFADTNQTRALIELFKPLSDGERENFLALEAFAALTPDIAKPSRKWIVEAAALASKAGGVRFLLFSLIRQPYYFDRNLWQLGYDQTTRRALIWFCAFWPAGDVVKPLTDLALRCFSPHPHGGIFNEVLGNACLWSLSQIGGFEALSALARIGARVRYPKVRQRINALFEEIARKAGRTRVEIDEEIPPHHGFDAKGLASLALADDVGVAEIRLDDHGKAQIVWRDAGGKALKAPSAKMKEQDALGVKNARITAREIETDHAVAAKRVEKLYRSDRALDFQRWREFYVEHPLIGPMCRRLIWRAVTPTGAVVGLWRDGVLEDVDGHTHDIAEGRLTLWHPLHADDVAQITAWRDLLEQRGIRQPFRQAWREVYRVTDAERATGSYSNRFAGHIVRQHQLMALARRNDWSCQHRMWQDVRNDEPTWCALLEHGVYAEYWTSGAGGEDPPVLESTAYIYLSTDRVVFHRLNPGAASNKPEELRGEPLAVDDVPPLAFSEIMRCCDLFVSVATIARDPNWLDRGAHARHPTPWDRDADAYWREAATAPLASSAEIRRTLLARMLPALGLRDSLSLDERYLHVRGVRGAYRIHLGSGAAFRVDGGHICIVPAGAPKNLALPFEGDEMLSMVLSKALLLSRDDKITDPVILRQL